MFRPFLYIFISFLVTIGTIFSQNLVPNNDFEQYSTCPFTSAQISYCNDWQNGGASVDYYNSCDVTNVASVPINVRGFQYASTGNAYIGLITYALDEIMDTSISGTDYREPATVELINPLVIGQKYFVSFKAVLTLNDFEACCASNKLGMLFSTVPYTSSNRVPINNFAHVYTNEIITDTVNWSTVSGSFVADSAYTYISIGNFYDTTNTLMIDYHNNYPVSSAAYYYIDDVKVSTDSAYVVGFQEGFNHLEFNIYPNPTNGPLIIENLPSDEYEIELYDLSGKLIGNYELDPTLSINLDLINNGLYIIILKGKHYHFAKHVILNK